MTAYRFHLLLILMFAYYFGNGQSVGIRGGVEFADKKQVSNAFGGGVFLTLNNFSEKVNIMVAFDYHGKNKCFTEKDLRTAYSKYRFSTAALYVKSFNKNFGIKIGPSVSYNFIKATHQGIMLRWITNYNTHAIGAEIIGGLEIKNIFQLPLSIDIFMTPSYLINISHNIKTKTDMTETKLEYGNNFFIMNFQVGVSYKFSQKSK